MEIAVPLQNGTAIFNLINETSIFNNIGFEINKGDFMTTVGSKSLLNYNTSKK